MTGPTPTLADVLAEVDRHIAEKDRECTAAAVRHQSANQQGNAEAAAFWIAAHERHIAQWAALKNLRESLVALG